MDSKQKTKDKRKEHYETELKVFPRRLKKRMEEKNVNQKELANAIGLSSRQSVGYYLQGTSSPDWERLVKIAEYLDTSADYLIGLSDNKSRNSDWQIVTNITGLTFDAINALHDVNGIKDHRREQYLQIINGLLGNYHFWYEMMQHARKALTYQEGAQFGGKFKQTGIPDNTIEQINAHVAALQMANIAGYNDYYVVDNKTAKDLEIHNALLWFEKLLHLIIDGTDEGSGTNGAHKAKDE